MKYLIEDTTLTAIGDAVRAKGNTEDKILVSNLATAINNLPSGDIEVEPIVLSGDCNYRCCESVSAKYIEIFGDTITTEKITTALAMFQNSTLAEIPFDINGDESKTYISMGSMFNGCRNLKSLPNLINFRPFASDNIFQGCEQLREIPEDIDSTWSWNYVDTLTSAYGGQRNALFKDCYSLRKYPNSFLNHGNPVAAYSTTIYYNSFNCCHSLDEIVDLPIPHYNASWTSNTFYNFAYNCYRLKELTFAVNEDGTPKTAKWKNQTINTKMFGYMVSSNEKIWLERYNHGITADKKVSDDASYQLLKDDPDYYTTDERYSLYNHDAAVRTINSLPDCSATGTNTIHFDKLYGLYTDEGPISNLTEEEIAVAVAKGWTVSLS